MLNYIPGVPQDRVPQEHPSSGCIDMLSPQCEFFDELEDFILAQNPYHIGCNDISLQCDFFDKLQDCLTFWKLCYTDCIYMVSPQCEFFDELEDCILGQNPYYIDSIDTVSPQCELFDEL